MSWRRSFHQKVVILQSSTSDNIVKEGFAKEERAALILTLQAANASTSKGKIVGVNPSALLTPHFMALNKNGFGSILQC